MTAVGYTRVSTQSQNLHPQSDALTAAGASKIFTDKITGKKAARPGHDVPEGPHIATIGNARLAP